MEIFQVTKEKWGSDSKRFTIIFVVCCIVFPGSIMVSMMYRNSIFDLSQVSEGSAQNSTALGVDSRKDSTVPASSHEGKILPNGTSEPDSTNVLSEPTRKPDEEMLNGTLFPEVGNGSGSKMEPSQFTSLASDKLLDGLVPPGLDERSCSSRYQSILYRKTSPRKPSPYLLSKLRGYEKLHKQCGPYTKSFNRTLKRLDAKRTSSRSKCNYIVWVPANGLGNRIISMAATFLYALLTNRVLLVDHGPDMADLFCEPFPNTTWLLPKHFPLRNHWKMRYANSFGTMLQAGTINMTMDSPPSHLYLNLDHSTYDLDKKLFYCDETEAFLRKINWLFMLSDQYFAPSFFLNPSYREEVSKLFPEKETIFYHLGRYLFNPSNQAWGLITRYFDAYLAKADQRVGIQVRVFRPESTPFQTVFDQILACTLKEKILPEIETQKPEAYSQSRNKTSKAILVTSLHSEFYGNLSSLYWTRATATGEVIGVYQPSHEEYQHFGDNVHSMKAWAEIYLLSLSDVLVTSAWSTFGYVAQGLGGLKPWILKKTNKDKIPNPPCMRDLSMEPCFHFPPKYDCQGKLKFDTSALLPCLRQCKDLASGVKLVADHNEL
ncbi:probable fucosyltransferase 7 isoform X1 [Ricinus communis]|uniref:Fucosyltransferase n=1 Tax=Ricinus communis TaxID=3988 RepID=B9SHT9_RICCO|nr:probable fucosyltransferase 7 isoform X1 [Ricinus communis]EEF36817.1 Galactoside 2-alpha-L-fucosyltransferase, putative [Ricinus communis]|eukprot:XP_015578730.1 probable fucosyltransferase 7 isoform X2 [Ricinus communis]